MLPFGLDRKALAVARDRGERQRPAAQVVRHRAVARIEGAVDANGVPALGVTDVLDRDVVVLAPEERNGIEALAPAEDVARRDLALALGNDPVFDADLRAGMG